MHYWEELCSTLPERMRKTGTQISTVLRDLPVISECGLCRLCLRARSWILVLNLFPIPHVQGLSPLLRAVSQILTLYIEMGRSKQNKWVIIDRFFLLIKTHLASAPNPQVRRRVSRWMHVLIFAFLLCPADSDAHSTTSSASPAQSPCYSNQSDDGSDTELSAGASRTPVFSFLDLTYWKR